MKVVSKIGLIVIASFALFFTGCDLISDGSAEQKVTKTTISEESLGLRKVDLYNEDTVTPDETKYAKGYAGSGKVINRAFQDAPPMIPHDVEGMLPITLNNNQCKDCHMPQTAVSIGATAIPDSHFIDFRPKTSLNKDGRITKNGSTIKNTSNEELSDISIKKMTKLSGSRFNCSQCHAPQSEGELVSNTFSADFTHKDGVKKSTWSGTKLTEGLDTLSD